MLQVEWPNPHPDKPLRHLELNAELTEAPVVIGGLTLRSVKTKPGNR
jgi:hypothetical protein